MVKGADNRSRARRKAGTNEKSNGAGHGKGYGKLHSKAGGAAKRTATGARSEQVAGRSLFEQHQSVAVDSLWRLLLEPASSLLTWSVIGIALALPLCLLLLLQNLQQLNATLDDAGNISLFMTLDASGQSLLQLSDEIRSRPDVADVTLITAGEALEEFQTTSGFGDVLSGLDENPLPPVLVVRPATGDAGLLPALAQDLAGYPGVESAQVDLEWVQRLYGIVALAERFTLGLGVLLCLGVILAVGNTVRLAIENRRDEILVVKLVGGTDAYVSRPFLYTGIWFGIGGGLIAVVLLLLAFLFLSGPVGRLMALYGGDFVLTGLSISDLFLLLLVSGGLGLAGAWLSVLRHLRRIEPV